MRLQRLVQDLGTALLGLSAGFSEPGPWIRREEVRPAADRLMTSGSITSARSGTTLAKTHVAGFLGQIRKVNAPLPWVDERHDPRVMAMTQRWLRRPDVSHHAPVLRLLAMTRATPPVRY